MIERHFKARIIILSTLLCLLALSIPTHAMAADVYLSNQIFDIPRLGKGKVDGDDRKSWRFRSGISAAAQRCGHRFIVAMPHNAMSEQGWKPIQVMDVIDEISAKYRVDPDRIYLTGGSMGGFGTWATATAYPERFAAIAPVCGLGDLADMAQLKNLPVWVVHGGKDIWIPIALDQQCVDALARIGGRVRYSFFEWEGHDVHFPNEIYDWFLEQKRGNPSQKPAEMKP